VRLALLLALFPLATSAEVRIPDYSDNRSSAADVVQSLYNAINRQEYLRAYSYYSYGSLGLYDWFAQGYADTAQVDLRIGQVTSEGAAGTLHHAVPVALQATDLKGKATVFIGCYRVTEVQASVQATPPFQPIEIEKGSLTVTKAPFATAMGTCD